MEKAFNDFNGKLILSCIRDGDFAHPGEVQAIELFISKLPRTEFNTILDAGAGLGATLALLAPKLNAKIVYGSDIDKESIEYCQANYPEYNWQQVDSQNLADKIKNSFDLIYIFNALYCVPDQKKAIAHIYNLLNVGGVFAVFDYSDLRDPALNQEFTNPFAVNSFKPISAELKSYIKSKFSKVVEYDLSQNYLEWYQELLQKLAAKKSLIIDKFGAVTFNDFKNKYQLMLEDIQSSVLGGVIIVAEK